MSILSRAATFGLFALSIGCAPAAQNASAPTAPAKAPGRYEETLTSGGKSRRFILRVPKGYDGSKPIPVVVVLHGWTSNAETAEKFFGFVEKGEAQTFATIYPQGLGQQPGWNAGFLNLTGQNGIDDVKFLSDVLDQAEKELKVDLDREYVCGHSNGAMLAAYAGSKLSNRLAAIGSVSGTIGLKTPGVGLLSTPISAIFIHGQQDPTVAYKEGDKALLSQDVGAEASASWWAQQDGCNPDPVKTKTGNGKATVETFSGGRGDTEVQLVSVVDGTHLNPMGSSSLRPADVLWNFFQKHPKRQG